MNNETMIDVILDNDAMDSSEFLDLFKELFDNQENRKYYEGIELDEAYKDAVDCLFDMESSVEERLDRAITGCCYCFEAYYFYKMLNDETDLFNYADLLLYSAKDSSKYKKLNDYETASLLMIFDDISSIYMFRDNYKKALSIIYTASEIDSNYFAINKIKLFICFERLEDYDSFKKFYDLGTADDLVSYLLYACVTIKALRTEELPELLMDMFHDFSEAYDVIKFRFLKEEYEADEEIELAFEIAKSSIESIPNFYDIVIDVIRKNNITPNILEN